MVRIPRKELDVAVKAIIECANNATDTARLRIVFPIDAHRAEKAVLAMLSMLAPGRGPATASDVYFGDIVDGQTRQFPAMKARI